MEPAKLFNTEQINKVGFKRTSTFNSQYKYYKGYLCNEFDQVLNTIVAGKVFETIMQCCLKLAYRGVCIIDYTVAMDG